jgi:TonB family protein
MIFGVLAAAAVAVAQPQAADSSTPTVIVNGRPPVGAKVDVSGDEENAINLVTVWPMSAYNARVGGQARLSCWVDALGLAETCRVVAESPTGLGFGAAALQMRPTFKLEPAKGPDGPIGSTMTIVLHFKAPDSQFGVGAAESAGIPGPEGAAENLGSGMQVQNALDLRPVTMLDRPIWARAATFEDLANAYPAQATGVEGYAIDHCKVLPDGSLTNCQTIKETPDKLGFGKAALGLANRFRVAPGWTRAPDRGDLWVDVPIRFEPPSASASRTVTAPIWLVGVDPDSAPKLFPPEAAAKGLTSGVGVARCTVQADGSLTDCAPETADPDGLGFSESAVRLASVMKMNPWTADAAPVDGASVEVRIQLELKADQ